MKTLALAALLAIASAAAAGDAPIVDMTAGRYTVTVSGLLCSACVKAMLEEVRNLPEVEKAGADLEKDVLTVVVKLNKTLRASALQKALSRAAKRANLGSPFEIRSVRYRVDTD